MKHLVTMFAVACITLAALPAPQEETVDSVLDTLQQASDQLTSFSADFEQVEVDEFGDRSTISGKAYFLKPGRMMFLSYKQGEKFEELAKNTEYAWRIRYRTGTVDRFGVDNSEDVNEGLDITSAEDLREAYNLELKGTVELENGPAWHLVGTPKEEGKIRKIELWINKNNPAPVTRAKTYQRRIETTFILTNIDRASQVDAGMFEYKVPKGFDEILH